MLLVMNIWSDIVFWMHMFLDRQLYFIVLLRFCWFCLLYMSHMIINCLSLDLFYTAPILKYFHNIWYSLIFPWGPLLHLVTLFCFHLPMINWWQLSSCNDNDSKFKLVKHISLCLVFLSILSVPQIIEHNVWPFLLVSAFCHNW